MKGAPSARRGALVGLLLTAQAEAAEQSALRPAGPHSQTLHDLTLFFTGVCVLVWIAVVMVLVIGLRRRQKHIEQGSRRPAFVVAAATAATVLILTGLATASFMATRAMFDPNGDALAVSIRGYQWWWSVSYPANNGQGAFMTANEMHVPIGRTVRLELTADDVIHSFWVPSLAGKQDLIPGRTNVLTFTAEKPGIYRGQCAEFCGLQHAHMGFVVVAEEPAAFAAWRDAQLAEGKAPQSDEEKRGREVFLAKPCAACHTLRGTSDGSSNSPDLTHFAGRTSLAAGIFPVTRGAVAAWVADPQTIKPGNHMPLVPLAPQELKDVSAYLMSLQ